MAIKKFLIMIFMTVALQSLCQISTNPVLIYSNGDISEVFFKCNIRYNDSINCVDTLVLSFMNRGQIIVYVEYKNGLKMKATGFYSNGQKFRETHFNGYQMHGLYIQWYSNGQIEYIAHYNNGVLISPSIEWYETGEIEGFGYFEQKSNIDISKLFYKNGQIKSESYNVDTIPKAFTQKRYYENGNLTSSGIMNLGIQPYVAYYKDGQKAWEGKIYQGTFAQVGLWKEWYENGILKREYIFSDSIPNYKIGTWSWWDEKGNLIQQEIYKTDKLIEEKKFLPYQRKE